MQKERKLFDRDCCRYRGPTSDSGRTGQMLFDWTDRWLVKSAQYATSTLALCSSQFCLLWMDTQRI